MPKNVLMVCHSVGDSQVLFETARVLSKQGDSSTILAVGQAAFDKVTFLKGLLSEARQSHITINHIDTLLSDKPVQNKQLTLTEEQIAALTSALKPSEYSALLVGTPSYANVTEQSQIPEQLLAAWSPLLHSAVVSDYAFYDPLHRISTHRWFEKANAFFVPFKKALQAFNVTEEKAAVVGHATIDASKVLYAKWLAEGNDKSATVRQALNIQLDEKLVFVAGGKAGDEAMLKALCQTCKVFPKIKIALGMHPTAEQRYLDTLQAILDEHDVSNQISFIPKGRLTTDEAVYAADGVITVSSTVGTTAASCGKPTVFYQEGKSEDDPAVPYVVSDYEWATFCISPVQLTPFYERVQASKTGIQAKDLIVESPAAQEIGRRLS